MREQLLIPTNSMLLDSIGQQAWLHDMATSSFHLQNRTIPYTNTHNIHEHTAKLSIMLHVRPAPLAAKPPMGGPIHAMAQTSPAISLWCNLHLGVLHIYVLHICLAYFATSIDHNVHLVGRACVVHGTSLPIESIM